MNTDMCTFENDVLYKHFRAINPSALKPWDELERHQKLIIQTIAGLSVDLDRDDISKVYIQERTRIKPKALTQELRQLREWDWLKLIASDTFKLSDLPKEALTAAVRETRKRAA